MLQAANMDLFNPLVPKAHNGECQNVRFSLEIKPIKVSYSQYADFYFFHPSLALVG